MTTTIQDEFTTLTVSRERKRQLRRQKAGLCRMCPARLRAGNGGTVTLCHTCTLAERRRHSDYHERVGRGRLRERRLARAKESSDDNNN